jgi:hypothetical protein
MDTEQSGGIGDGRVAAIEDAQLHQFIGRDIVDEFDADGFERRPALREIVFQHPLPERFADDRRCIVDTELFRDETRSRAVPWPA